MICVDASVVVKWLFLEEQSTEARGLLHAALATEEPIIAPPLVLSEVANAIRHKVRQGQLEIDQARALLVDLLAYPVSIRATDDVFDRALTLAHTHDLPAIYDAQYVALAEMSGADLWTADGRLLRRLGGLAFMHDIADWRPVDDGGPT